MRIGLLATFMILWVAGCVPALQEKDVVGGYLREETTAPKVTGFSNVGPARIEIQPDHICMIHFTFTPEMLKGTWAFDGQKITVTNIQIGEPGREPSMKLIFNPYETSKYAGIIDQFPNGEHFVDLLRQGRTDFKPFTLTPDSGATKLIASDGTPWTRVSN